MAKKHSQDKDFPAKVRLIGGQWRGRQLPVLLRQGLRPTPSRVRETLFNWLCHDIRGAHCLDVCAGSGVLGFEALSRGAKKVDLIEQDKGVVTQLNANQKSLAISEHVLSIIRADAITWLSHQAGSCYDIVFVDPPYDSPLLPVILRLLVEKGWLNPLAKVYFESGQSVAHLQLPQEYELLKEKKAGQVYYYLAMLRSDTT